MAADSNSSSETPNRPTESESGGPLTVGSFSVDDAIQMHLVDCDQCRTFTERGRPVPNVRMPGNKGDGHCGNYWQLILMRARYEGMVNNITAHTEFGDEALKLGRLDPNEGMA